MSRPAIAATALAGLLAVAVPVAASASASGPTATASAVKVAVKDNRFSPSRVSVRKGGRVTWVWSRRNRQAHNVTGSSFGSLTRSRGYRYSHRFPRRGSFLIVCTVHSGMEMRVRVR